MALGPAPPSLSCACCTAATDGHLAACCAVDGGEACQGREGEEGPGGEQPQALQHDAPAVRPGWGRVKGGEGASSGLWIRGLGEGLRIRAPPSGGWRCPCGWEGGGGTHQGAAPGRLQVPLWMGFRFTYASGRRPPAAPGAHAVWPGVEMELGGGGSSGGPATSIRGAGAGPTRGVQGRRAGALIHSGAALPPCRQSAALCAAPPKHPSTRATPEAQTPSGCLFGVHPMGRARGILPEAPARFPAFRRLSACAVPPLRPRASAAP
jgi:hypothetical protein